MNKKSRKSQYHPEDSKINFAVPDEKVLRDYNTVLLKIILPGKINQGLNLLSGKKDIIMMADGKLVAKGLKMILRETLTFLDMRQIQTWRK